MLTTLILTFLSCAVCYAVGHYFGYRKGYLFGAALAQQVVDACNGQHRIEARYRSTGPSLEISTGKPNLKVVK